VQGDTTSCFAGALAAFYEHVPVVHVEAGLRTWDRDNPFPEEMNRTLTGQLATLHLAVSPVSRDNLLREGIDSQAVVVTGNTVIDALLQTVKRRVPYTDPRIPALLEDNQRTLLVTAHRRESWGDGMARVAAALAELAIEDPALGVVLPAHLNPVVRETLLPPLGHLNNVLVVDPLPYGEFCRLMSDVDLLLTDSGGVQEEGPSVGRRVLVMRETTERPEGLAAGAAQLVGTDTAVIVKAVRESLRDQQASRFDPSRNPYGDGHAARRSVAAIAELLGKGRREPDFIPN
jgi:UDP-N-acetylglucosamine 2-epimerase (non-hydrolysing)